MSLLDLIQSNPEEAQAAIFAALNDRAFDYLDNYKLDETAYQSDIDEKKPVVVHGVKGVKSVPFKKKFKSMKHYEKWADSEEFGNHEVHRVVQESTDDQDFDDEELDEAVVAGSVKKDAKGNVKSFKTVGDKHDPVVKGSVKKDKDGNVVSFKTEEVDEEQLVKAK